MKSGRWRLVNPLADHNNEEAEFYVPGRPAGDITDKQPGGLARPGHNGDCPDFRVNENGTVPFRLDFDDFDRPDTKILTSPTARISDETGHCTSNRFCRASACGHRCQPVLLAGPRMHQMVDRADSEFRSMGSRAVRSALCDCVPGFSARLGVDFGRRVFVWTSERDRGGVAGRNLGAGIAFLVSRAIGRQWLEGKLLTHPRAAPSTAPSGARLQNRAAGPAVLVVSLRSDELRVRADQGFAGQICSGHLAGKTSRNHSLGLSAANAKNLSDLAAGKIQSGIGAQILLWLGLAATVAVAIVLAEISRRARCEAVDAPHEKATSDMNDGG